MVRYYLLSLFLTIAFIFSLYISLPKKIENTTNKIIEALPYLNIYLKAKKFYLLNLYPKDTYNKVAILCFHNIDGKGRFSISQETFRLYLKEIQEKNIQVIPLKKLWKYHENNIPFTKPSVVITIDDNYKNIVRVLAPILRDHNYPATFFVYAQNIYNEPRAGVAWEDLVRLQQEGFSIQNHSYTHSRFDKKPAHMSQSEYKQILIKETITSKEYIENKIPNLEIWAFAYPMNYYNQALEKHMAPTYPLRLNTDGHSVNIQDKFTGLVSRIAIEKVSDARSSKQVIMPIFYRRMQEITTSKLKLNSQKISKKKGNEQK